MPEYFLFSVGRHDWRAVIRTKIVEALSSSDRFCVYHFSALLVGNVTPQAEEFLSKMLGVVAAKVTLARVFRVLLRCSHEQESNSL
jgi:hypothetical protein